MAREADEDEMAFATFDAAIEAAGFALDVPLVGPAAAGSVDDEERTVILGVEVTPVFSVARRKLGMERAGCGLAPLKLVLELDALSLWMDPSLTELE